MDHQLKAIIFTVEKKSFAAPIACLILGIRCSCLHLAESEILFAKLSDNYNGNSVTKTDVDQAYNELCSESYLNTWSERLVEYRELERPARQILKALSSDKAGIDRDGLLNILMTGRDAAKAEETDNLLSHVLEMLENDGYLLRKGSVRTFRSPLLRDYWYGKFVQ